MKKENGDYWMKDCKFFDIIDGIYGLPFYYCVYDNSECMCTDFCENYVKEESVILDDWKTIL